MRWPCPSQEADIAHSSAHISFFAMIASCRCFARRVNVVEAWNVVAAQFENPLPIKPASTVHGVVFDLFA
jgi:hypothetical protein